MSDTVFDGSNHLDCMVGGVLEQIPPADDMRSQLHVTVRGEGLSGFGALACAQELKFLIQAFRGYARPPTHGVVQRLADLPPCGKRTVEIRQASRD